MLLELLFQPSGMPAPDRQILLYPSVSGNNPKRLQESPLTKLNNGTEGANTLKSLRYKGLQIRFNLIFVYYYRPVCRAT